MHTKHIISPLIILALLLLVIVEISAQSILPSIHDWKGKSEMLIVGKDNPWISPAETNDFLLTPSHAESMNWFLKLADASELISFKTIGLSAQNRPIFMLVASKEIALHVDETLKGEKPNVLVQAGIHSGEIDGKDAGMMLLRDIAFGGKDDLLDQINLLFIPILSVDGHENASPYNRPNQRGPENMGWRTNARNLNLNRDYPKLETEGIKAVVNVMKQADPIFYVDVHVTDGADYQYDITYGYRKKNGYSPQITNWLSKHYQPEVDKSLTNFGHVPGPLIFTFKGDDFSNGIIDYYLPLRFSDAYGDARHIPSILVENHSLKPYRQRVLGTYIYLEQTLKSISTNLEALLYAIHQDRSSRPDSIPLSFGFSKIQSDSIDLLLYKANASYSDITKRNYPVWTDIKEEKKVPHLKMDDPLMYTEVPKAYWIPAEWGDIIDKLAAHGIEIQINKAPLEKELTQYLIEEYEINPVPSEGRFRFKNFSLKKVKRKIKLNMGSARISTEQDLRTLLTLLLEPNAPDSFFQWGYFHTILSRTEYIERYVMEPLILKMIQEDKELLKRFEDKKINDPTFAENPNAIYQWFYKQTAYFDKNWKLIPIGLEY